MRKKGRRGHGEGTVTQRKDGRWHGAFYSDDGKRHFVYGSTQQEALAKLRKAQREDEQGTLATGPNLKVDAYLQQWLEEVQKPTVRISTYVKYKKLINTYIVPALGGYQLQKLMPQHIQALYTNMGKKGLSAKTIQNVHGLLHNALDNALRWNMVSRNVTSVVKPPRVRKKEKQAVNLEQARALMLAARGERLEMFIALALTTGMRRGELLALRWSDVDLDSRVLHVRRTVDFIARYGYVENEPKTERSRRDILLPLFVINMLKAHRVSQLEQRLKVGKKWVDLDLVICGLEGNYLNPRYILKMFSKLLQSAGLPHMRIHDLRHSVLSLLVGMQIDPLSVQELAGHEDITTTLGIYGHVNYAMLQFIADKFDEVFKQDWMSDDVN